jgi:hypothetical protein
MTHIALSFENNINIIALRSTDKRKEYGEYIRKDGEGKWKYRLKRIKLEAGHYTHERLGFQLRKK